MANIINNTNLGCLIFKLIDTNRQRMFAYRYKLKFSTKVLVIYGKLFNYIKFSGYNSVNSFGAYYTYTNTNENHPQCFQA